MTECAIIFMTHGVPFMFLVDTITLLHMYNKTKNLRKTLYRCLSSV